MKKYANLGGNSNVVGYDEIPGGIVIYFRGAPKPYTYMAYTIGEDNLHEMIRLAHAGQGLNALINTNEIVRDGYVR